MSFKIYIKNCAVFKTMHVWLKRYRSSPWKWNYNTFFTSLLFLSGQGDQKWWSVGWDHNQQGAR